MAGFFGRRKKKEDGTTPGDAPAPKRSLFSGSLFSRKKTAAVAPDLLAEPAAAPEKRGRKAKKSAAPLVPKLPDATRVPPEPIELDNDGLLSAGRRKLAVGLLWQPRDRKLGIHAQAKAASIDGNALDLSVTFAGGAQVGFASKLDGIKPGTVAAATAIPREMTGDTWLGAFVVPVPGDQYQLVWWVVALREGMVYEDRLVRNEIDARDSFLDLLEAPDWQVVVCPATWQVENSTDLPLALMLPKRSKGATLQIHDPVRVWAPRAAAAAIVLGAAFGGYSYFQSIEQQRILEEQARLAAEEAQRLADMQVAPWETMPDMMSFTRRCALAMQSILVFPPGWRMDPIRCTATPEGGALELTWTREDGGKAGWLLAALADRGLPAPALSPELNSAQVSIPVPITPHEWGEVTPMQPATMVQMLQLRFNTLSLTFPLTEMVARATPQAPGIPVTKIWNYHSIEFRSSTTLEEYIQLISDVPAAVPEFLTYDPYTSDWQLVANIYHPPLNVQG
jgi:hypothetical protein